MVYLFYACLEFGPDQQAAKKLESQVLVRRHHCQLLNRMKNVVNKTTTNLIYLVPVLIL